MNQSLWKRIFRSLCLLALAAVLLTSALVSGVIYARTENGLHAEVQREAALIAAGIDAAGPGFLQSVPQGTANRVTRIAPDGAVLFDTAAAAGAMENHLSRPEIQAALASGISGEATRLSETLGLQNYYFARMLADGTVLRVATATDSALGAAYAAAPALMVIALAVLLLTLLLARRMADAILGPLNALDLQHPENNTAYEELSPLLARLMEQKRTVRRQMAELSARQEEFRTLSENMDEGLLLLGPHAEILSVNGSARAVLGGDPQKEYTGRHLLLLSRDYTLQTLTKSALGGTRSEAMLETGGRQYQVIASPVRAQNTMRGALLLLLDVTERQQSERLRREFSANVSHELKTPLTSISGYAEMLAGGLVRPEDIRAFAGRIHSEAGRLLSLIEDIIKLSFLDEQTAPPTREPVELLSLARQAQERLELTAQNNGVSISVSGEAAYVWGTRTQLAELIYNLSENAVKYNRSGGSVLLHVINAADGPTLTVKDTGIGIPLEAQPRVFERFYRVDKSRSKETGGTGLGLSIVKHIALLHGGHIALQSTPGQGTAVQVRFPQA